MSQQTPTHTKPTPACATPICPASSKTCPKCEEGYFCRLSVIDSTCECPVATCERIDFETGADNDDDSSSSSSIVGPIVGAIAGLGVVALIAFFVIRRRRRRQRLQRHGSLGQEDSMDSFGKRWHSSTSSELGGHKDIIRIAYIPSMISDSSPITTPGPSAQINGAPQPRFSPLRNEDRSKHDSVASTMSGIVDEAVVMAVSSKATPQVMRLNTIKATKSDLIQRSNTLHSSNSIKRSRSQRRIANANNGSNSSSSRMNPSPLSGAQSDTESDQDNDYDDASRAGAVQTRRPSAGSMAESDAANPFLSQAELTAVETPSSNTRQHHRDSTANVSTRSSNPFLSISESTAVASNTNTMYSTSSPSTPTSESATVFASIPITLADHHYDPNDPTAGLPEPNLRPWTSSGSVTMRDSTFSTLSDSRSSTRGDGEEIMIFWDGHRDSKASNL